MDVVIVAHTHWDREWYHPVGRFRQQLVRLVDTLLDDPDGAPFLLDGQASALEDYLAVRPDRRDALGAALVTGEIEAGPWYVLADNLIASGESLVRNLLVGRSILGEFGASPPLVLYCPDAFGHPAALPAVAAGFGFPLIIGWRGHGGSSAPPGDTLWWTAASGERALLYHLSPDGYEFGSALPIDEDAVAERWARVRSVLEPRASVGVALLPNGADHHARQRQLAQAIERLARAAAPHTVTRTSLGAFSRLLNERAGAHELPAVAGELRDSYGYTWTLQGTLASRAHQKREVAHRDRELRWDVEPWLALVGARPFTSELRLAWRTLLACYPHDTLCGCSTDDVALAMEDRLRDASAQAAGLRTDALAAALGVDVGRTRGRRASWQPAVVVRNPMPRERSGVVELELLTTIADEPVGPGSAAGARAALALVREARRRPSAPPHIRGLAPLQILGESVRRERVESPHHYPDSDIVHARRALAWIPSLPPAGVASYPTVVEGPSATMPDPGVVSRPPDVTIEDEGDRIRMSNGTLSVSIADDGAIRLTTRDEMFDVTPLLGIEDRADRGDLYTASLVGPPRRAWRCTGRSITAHGPLRASVELRMVVGIPASRRSTARVVDHTIRLTLALDAGASFLRVAVRGRNRARDHRLRLVVATGLAGATVAADAAFGPVLRTPIATSAASAAMETPPPTAPLHRYVSLRHDGQGVTLVSDGLAEYEATKDGRVAITLVRAVGALSRATLPERPGHAGWPTPTPLAQCRRRFEAMFAIAPHPAGLSDADARVFAERVAEEVVTPPIGETWRAVHTLPTAIVGPRLDGHGLVASAIKPSEDGQGIVLRCTNILDEAVDGSWTVPNARAAWLARLDETPLESLAVARDGEIVLRVASRATVTILVHSA